MSIASSASAGSWGGGAGRSLAESKQTLTYEPKHRFGASGVLSFGSASSVLAPSPSLGSGGYPQAENIKNDAINARMRISRLYARRQILRGWRDS